LQQGVGNRMDDSVQARRIAAAGQYAYAHGGPFIVGGMTRLSMDSAHGIVQTYRFIVGKDIQKRDLDELPQRFGGMS